MAAVGTVTIVEEVFDSVKLISWSWIGGSAETALAAATTTSFYTGRLIFCVTNPGTSDAPADNYSVTILDKNDVDVLADGGLNRATGTTESILEANLGAVANSQLELVVQNSGSSGTANGLVYLFIR
ncbi:hypothetical protein LCGC14_2028730 [marine sediment metagenome]|uniref:Uncharacterized protein n=1 Tax=marine sediment metagenome TaxID=412755 RepID=A0A0F9EVE5_9ZZZZ